LGICAMRFFLLNSLHVLAGSCLSKLNGTNIIVQLFTGYYYDYLNLAIIWEPMCYLLLLWKQICSFTFLQFPHTSAHLWFSGIVYSTYRLISRIRASRNLNQHILL